MKENNKPRIIDFFIKENFGFKKSINRFLPKDRKLSKKQFVFPQIIYLYITTLLNQHAEYMTMKNTKPALNRLLSSICKTFICFAICTFWTQTAQAQFQVQITTTESRCSANGQITLKVTGGTAPYSYQLLGSTRPVQTTDIFNLLPPGTYQIRITDNTGTSMNVNATVSGNYQTPTTQCSVNNYTVTMSTTGGRPPFMYAYALYEGAFYLSPQTSNIFPCLPYGKHNFRVYDSCGNFHTTTCMIDVKPLVDTVFCQQVNGKINITTKGFSGGVPPYLFTCINNLGDTFRNTTGNFPQLTGCTFTFIFSDKCEKKEQKLTCSTLKGYVKCANFNDNTASVWAEGGVPPYRFQSLDRSGFSSTGIFANLPPNDETYNFNVRDACGANFFFDVGKMNVKRTNSFSCPFTGKLQIQLSQNASLSDTCHRCSSFYPYRFDCLDCRPPRTIIDSFDNLTNPQAAFADFSPTPAGMYNFVVTNGCQDTIHFTSEARLSPPPLNVSYNCKTNTITANTDLPGSTYFFRDSLERLLATNSTGIFIAPYSGLFRIYATYPTCDTMYRPLNTKQKADICYRLSSKINSSTNQCEFRWVLDAKLPATSSYQLTGGPDSIKVINTTGVFPDLAPLSTYYLKTDCTLDTIKTATATLPNLSVRNFSNCTFSASFQAQGGRKVLGCSQQYVDQYVLYDSIGNYIAGNETGKFPSLIPGKLYDVRILTPEGCFIQSLKIRAQKYMRPVLTASYGIICATGQTTGNIRAIVNGGVPPFTFQITAPSGIRNPIVVRENTALFTDLSPENYTLQVADSCGTSSDYATSIGALQFTPQYKRRCDGNLTLEVPFIDSATYVWTNSAGTVVGNNRILSLNDTTAQVFTIKITTPQPCNFTTSITIPRFTRLNVGANAGADFVSTTPTTNLRASATPSGTTGRWRQIEPSSANIFFGNINNPTSSINAPVIPGEYTLVWEITDNISGCISTDTVTVTFCNDAILLNATITTMPSECKKSTGKATVSVVSSSTSIIYRWSNGKTTPSVDSLAAGTYTVTISSPLFCSPTRVDTVVIKTPNPIAPRTIDSTLCVGSSLKVGSKVYTQAGSYKDTLQSVSGCDSIIHSNLRFSRVPVENLGIIHNLTAQYCGDSLALNSKGDSSAQYQWFWQNVPCPTCRNPRILPLSTPVFMVTITDKLTRCTAKDSVNVKIEGGFMARIPNAFSPNGDGKNDVFNVLPDPCIKIVSRLRIFNRWGEKIFDKPNLSPNKNEGWNGMDHHDALYLASDVYVFIMEIEFVDGTTKKVSGEINLIH
jgi:gliding motility-associated-like protein